MKKLTLIAILFFCSTSFAQKVDKIVVYKKERRMLLLSNDDIVREYNVKLSYSYNNPLFTAAPKTRRGDNQTPEGTYFVKQKLNASWSNFKKSLLINYPNKEDIAKGKAQGVSVYDLGDAIQIHGFPKRIDPTLKSIFGKLMPWGSDDEDLKNFFYSYIYPNFDWTNGCVAVTDEEMDEIFELVSEKTAVIIKAHE
ncbi:murein L,D-transpeptidase family protein [Bacteriovorax sp. Seq25_V]|uniref:L,D-transpeptidase family protein n=1 Tax=Bacteriovorax sp. Seq25_V TaxID=1201288 RepID=UPI00038A4F1A|nr:L,D-transpeptidase family protein [Bacteriovorax sp. Seq25_V]EQC44052.1 L,D-transpeptidase catalytic domain protein [Bacteriovorax sp. Seq25_V]